MWRNTGLPARLFVLDARACIPLLVLVTGWTWNTLAIAVCGVVFFGAIAWTGYTLPAVLRLLRRLVVGAVRAAVPAWNRRRLA